MFLNGRERSSIVFFVVSEFIIFFFEVEEVFEECGDDVLNNLLNILSERDYYENYNK